MREKVGGFLYLDMVLSISVFILLIHSAILIVHDVQQERILYEEGQRMVLRIRRLQQESMQSSQREDLTVKSLQISRHSYCYNQNNRDFDEQLLASRIINPEGTAIIAFQKNGLPCFDKKVVLCAENTKHFLTIYIAVQTGRVRLHAWKSL